MTSSNETKTETDWDMIQAQLPSDWRELAGEKGLIREQPKQLGAKVQDIGEILRLVLHRAGTSSSLRVTAALAAAAGMLSMSGVALHKWFVKIGPYLAALLERMVQGAAYAPQRWGGFDIIAGDATTVQRPGSKGTTARVHYALRLSDLTPRHIDVTDEHGGETARRFRAEPGELWLLDRGYSNPAGVAAITEAGAEIVVRHNRGTLPLYDAWGDRIDVAALLRKTTDRETAHELPAFVHCGGECIVGRLCWLRLPKDKAATARKRAEREADGPCDPETLYAAEFVVVFTSVVSTLTAAQVLELYRARWQVELEFKRAKSIRELDRLPNFLPETIHSWICAKLLLQLVATRIASPSVDFPPAGHGIQLFSATSTPQASSSRRRRGAMVRRSDRLGRRVLRLDTGHAA